MLSTEDLAVVESVDRFLADGLALRRWWSEAAPERRFAERFELTRTFNRPDESFGFFDEVPLTRGLVPIMGNYQEMFYDQPRAPLRFQQEGAAWMRDQLREFVLRYFMRVSDYRLPESYVDELVIPVPPFLPGLSWCPRVDISRVGFGFTQVFYKLRGTGEVGRFAEEDEYEIVDLRELFRVYEWIVVKVNIFDFRFTLRPLGPAFDLGVPLKEESYLVLTRDFVVDEEAPTRGLLGEYGLGYAFIRNPNQGLLAYGPGEFDSAIELFDFRISEAGEVRVALVFVATRPQRIANLFLDPIDWSLRAAELFSLGLASRLLTPLRSALARLRLRAGPFDPVYGWVSVANALTGELAAQRWCISREQLDKDFLVRHFLQHYQTIVGSLATWRHIPDWLDTDALPEWIVKGTSS